MKKKGRVSGTIGWLLAVILCLGVIGYSTYLGISGFMGAATANAIVARFNETEKQAGEANTKQLVKDTATGVTAATEGLTYNSFTIEYSYATYAEDETVGKASSTSSGIAYINNEYVYIKASAETVVNKEFKTVYTELVIDKASGKTYYRENAVAQNAKDSLLLDNAVWTTTEPTENAAANFLATLSMFTPLTADGVAMEFDVISGEYKFESAIDEATTAKYGFTVGYRPNLFAKVFTADEKNVAAFTLTYSNINNTKLVLSKSLQDTIGQEVGA